MVWWVNKVEVWSVLFWGGRVCVDVVVIRKFCGCLVEFFDWVDVDEEFVGCWCNDFLGVWEFLLLEW